MKRVSLFAIIFISLTPLIIQAQSQPDSAPNKTSLDQALGLARQHLLKGEGCLKEGNTDCARREFDMAIDTVLELGVDIRSDAVLKAGFRELIEKISYYETSASQLNANRFWRTQDFEGRPPVDTAKAIEAKDYTSSGPLTTDEFQQRFEELRKAFRDKYNRDITLTGADHEEHRRLYGRGSAYDIRVRDLTREQVNFIVSSGRQLGLRIKDFSTWDKVANHNARSLMLGRPLDTFATGIHLHIDRMSSSRKRTFQTTPAVNSKLRKAEQSGKN